MGYTEAKQIAEIVTLATPDADERDARCAQLAKLFPEFAWGLDDDDRIQVQRWPTSIELRRGTDMDRRGTPRPAGKSLTRSGTRDWARVRARRGKPA